jgi:hypothetical protein
MLAERLGQNHLEQASCDITINKTDNNKYKYISRS